MFLPLEGFVVGVTADRRAGEQAELLRRQGATVVPAPTIATGYLSGDDRLRAATGSVVAHPPQLLVASTAIGMRAWFEAAQSWGLDRSLLQALATARIVARGPKAAGAVEGLGLPVWRRAADERTSGMLRVLHDERVPLAGQRVVVQRHGGDDLGIVAALVTGGAEVVEIPVYRWAMPSDLDPAVALIGAVCAGSVDAVTFTVAAALDHFFALAESRGCVEAVRRAFNGSVVAACVGPACAEAATKWAITDPAAPDLGRLGLMVRALTRRLSEQQATLQVGGSTVNIQGRAVDIGGAKEQLTNREHAVLRQLLDQSGAVVSRATMLRAAWPAGQSPHAVEVAIGRLRRKLGPAGQAIQTVPRRGYRLATD